VGHLRAATSADIPQAFRRDGVTVDLAATTVFAGNVITYTYIMHSLPVSSQRLWKFAIHTLSPVSSPSEPAGWHGDTMGPFSSLWSWGAIDPSSDVLPGGSAVAFRFSSTGLPGIVTYRAQGYAPLPSVEDLPPGAEKAMAFLTNSFEGHTAGPSHVTLDATPADILTFLKNQQHRALELKWLPTVARLDNILAAVRAAVARGDNQAAKGYLIFYRAEASFQARRAQLGYAFPVLETGAYVLESKL
jgi:hypothetical protein